MDRAIEDYFKLLTKIDPKLSEYVTLRQLDYRSFDQLKEDVIYLRVNRKVELLDRLPDKITKRINTLDLANVQTSFSLNLSRYHNLKFFSCSTANNISVTITGAENLRRVSIKSVEVLSGITIDNLQSVTKLVIPSYTIPYFATHDLDELRELEIYLNTLEEINLTDWMQLESLSLYGMFNKKEYDINDKLRYPISLRSLSLVGMELEIVDLSQLTNLENLELFEINTTSTTIFDEKREFTGKVEINGLDNTKLRVFEIETVPLKDTLFTSQELKDLQFLSLIDVPGEIKLAPLRSLKLVVRYSSQDHSSITFTNHNTQKSDEVERFKTSFTGFFLYNPEFVEIKYDNNDNNSSNLKFLEMNTDKLDKLLLDYTLERAYKHREDLLI